MDEEQITGVQGATSWMMLSPYWLAKFHYETARRNHGFAPPLEGLGQMLLDRYNLGVPARMLRSWIEEFKYIS